MTADPAIAGSSAPLSKSDQVRKIIEQSVERLSTQLEAGNSDQLNAFLKAMGRFHHYSFGNILLIMSQNPEATRVAGFHTWLSLGRSVKRGEKGIAIFAPMMIKPKDGDTDSNARGDDRSSSPRLRFRVVYVFDISQTEGEDLPEPVRVGGDPGVFLERLELAVRNAGIVLETVETLGGADGVSKGGTIALIADLTPAERFSVLVHEWAHEQLHRVAREERPDKTVRETEAEAVAFVVSQSIGLDTATASADYIRIYRGDKDTLTGSLDRIQKTAAAIIEAITDSPDLDRSPRRGQVDSVPGVVLASDRRQR